MAASFEVKHLQKNRFTHPLSLSILHLEPSPRRDSNHHRNKISSLKPTGGERGVTLRIEPPGDGVSLRVNPGRGGGGTWSYLKDNSWDLVNQGKILCVKGASLDGLALKLKFSERKWSVTVGKDS
ncbi:hypothetical protein F2Q70_00040586 [Brassica cretica]|uniref:Uncharacterized protein n=1 Tax=Brassica cretica TaxID=69181 RepID=A0A8S9KCZ4_BRACR|nr:hypothetical protein F2Q70_00040586 [Brassica cretica]